MESVPEPNTGGVTKSIKVNVFPMSSTASRSGIAISFDLIKRAHGDVGGGGSGNGQKCFPVLFNVSELGSCYTISIQDVAAVSGREVTEEGNHSGNFQSIMTRLSL